MKNFLLLFSFPKIKLIWSIDVILSSFSCEAWGYSNNDVTFGGEIADKGVEIDVNVYAKDWLNRFVVKSEWAIITVPELDLEIPKSTQKGSIKTIEGYIRATAEGLKLNQEERRIQDPDTAMKIDDFIEKLERICEGKDMPWHFKIDDPSGNSYVQNPHAPANDVYVSTKHYERTKQDLVDMGFTDPDAVKEDSKEVRKEEEGDHKEIKKPDFSPEEVEEMMKRAREKDAKKEERQYEKNEEEKDNFENEVFRIPMPWYQCGAQGMQKSCLSYIPHFKEIIIMAFNWEGWGFRSVEVKQGGGVSEKGKRLTLKVKNERDLTRDLFKGDDSRVLIPELDLELEPGSLGGIYTTVEGLISKIHDKLEEVNPFAAGDSSLDDKFRKFLKGLDSLKDGDKEFTLVLDDPMANCYIYSPLHPEEDPQITVENYERTHEQKEMLGLNDMKVD